MATDLQRDLAEAIVLNVRKPRKARKNKTELLESIGYSKKTASHEQRIIIEGKGVQEELKKLGFDSDNAKRVVGEILNRDKAKDSDRLKAAEQVFKVNSDYAPEKSINLNIKGDATENQIELAKRLHDIRSRLKGDKDTV